jgi:uncharacterized RDD family membrane protein YckC
MRKLRSWLNAKLDSPFKRFAAMVAAIGLAMLLIGWLQIVARYWQFSSCISVMIDHLLLDDKEYMLFTYGAYLFSIGLMGSVLYTNSIGHVVKWIGGDAVTSKGNVMSIYCSQCGVAVSGDSKFCFKCGGAIHQDVLAASNPVETPFQAAREHAPPNEFSALDAALGNLRQATRWPRFFARTLDMWLFLSILSVLIAIPLAVLDPAFGRWLQEPGSAYLYAIPLVPIYLLAEAVCYAMFGNTPGKTLLAIRIGDLSGRRLTFKEFLQRNFKLWDSGLACGIPIVSMFTYYNQSRRVYAGRPASYDEKLGTRAFGKKLGAGRIVSFSIVFVLLLVLLRAGA